MFDMGSHTSATAVYPRCTHLHTHTYNLYYRCELLLHMWPLHSPPRSADCLNLFLPSSLVDFFPSVHRSVILCIVVTHISNRARKPTPQVKNLGHMLWIWGDKLSWERPGSTPKARPRSLRSSITFYKLGERQRKKSSVWLEAENKRKKCMNRQEKVSVCISISFFLERKYPLVCLFPMSGQLLCLFCLLPTSSPAACLPACLFSRTSESPRPPSPLMCRKRIQPPLLSC